MKKIIAKCFFTTNTCNLTGETFSTIKQAGTTEQAKWKLRGSCSNVHVPYRLCSSTTLLKEQQTHSVPPLFIAKAYPLEALLGSHSQMNTSPTAASILILCLVW